jgi:hypothetical protein
MNQITSGDVERLLVMINGGEYREQLPGRGIVRVTRYRPLADITVDAIVSSVETVCSWVDALITTVCDLVLPGD